MFKGYKNGQEILQNDSFEILKEKITELARNNVNVQFSIRNEIIPIVHAAIFTIKYFNECALESSWHKIKNGIYTTECDYKKILIGIVDLNGG